MVALEHDRHLVPGRHDDLIRQQSADPSDLVIGTGAVSLVERKEVVILLDVELTRCGKDTLLCRRRQVDGGVDFVAVPGGEIGAVERQKGDVTD